MKQLLRLTKGLGHHDATRTYGFDLSPHWQEDKDHYDNQKINGLTFPRTIRQSAFTQKLDIEGCDPLALPLAALIYQQANGQRLLASKTGPWTRSLPDPYGGDRNCCLYDGAFDAAQKPWGRPGPCLT